MTSHQTLWRRQARTAPNHAYAIATIVLFGIAVTAGAATLNIWTDEYDTLVTTSGSLGHALARALDYESQAPLYFLALTLWRKLDGSVSFARLFSVAAMIATLSLVPALARRYVRGLDEIWVLLLVAINPWSIWAAMEMRLYALLELFVAAFLLLFYDEFLRDGQRSDARRAGLVAVAVAGMATQYAFGLLLVGGFVALAALRRTRALRDFTVCGIVVAPFALGLAALARGQVATYEGPHALHPLGLVRLAGSFVTFVLPTDWSGRGFQSASTMAIVAGGAAIVLTIAVLAKPALDVGAKALVIVSVVCIALFPLLALVLHVAELSHKHASILALPLELALLAIVASGRPPARRVALTAYVVLLVAFSLVTFRARYAHLAKSGDWARVANYLEEHDHSDPIFAYDATSSRVLHFYYSGPAPIVAIPRTPSEVTWRFDNSRIPDDRTLDRVFASLRGPGWIAEIDRCRYFVLPESCARLDAYVGRHFITSQQRAFDGSRVYRIVRIEQHEWIRHNPIH